MEHKKLSIEYDLNLIDKTLDDKDMRYIILFLYIIRNDLFKDFSDIPLIESYERILILDDIYKSNIDQFWERNFIEIAIDLGLFKNIRSLQEYDQKDPDFIIKLGDETVTLENDMIMVPDDLLYLMIHKKFKNISRRNFNLSLSKLKALKCEYANIIHPFIFQIDENDYTISDDLYQYGKDIIPFLKDEKIKLPDKFNTENIDKNSEIYKSWSDKLYSLLLKNNQLYELEDSLNEIKEIYSGINKKSSYLQFVEKISFNEDDILAKIQAKLITLRDDIVKVKSEIADFTMKDLKLLNLDYERLIIMSNED
ncbi:MAG: hypothetical protein P8Y23_08975 [Candidatus Lokiarchaeota archaeon]